MINEDAKKYCEECSHVEMCRWYPEYGCEFRDAGVYERGYNDAKREISLSGEYERAYQRGFEDGRKSEWTAVAELDKNSTELGKENDELISRQTAIEALEHDRDCMPHEYSIHRLPGNRQRKEE